VSLSLSPFLDLNQGLPVVTGRSAAELKGVGYHPNDHEDNQRYSDDERYRHNRPLHGDPVERFLYGCLEGGFV
jgi:hypothetical protein